MKDFASMMNTWGRQLLYSVLGGCLSLDSGCMNTPLGHEIVFVIITFSMFME